MNDETLTVTEPAVSTPAAEESVVIEKGKVVTMHYRLSDESGEIENSHAGDPLVYLQGFGNIMPGLEKAMVGKRNGDTFSVTVPPELAYGEVIQGSRQRVPIKHLLRKSKAKLKEGQVVSVQTDQGPRQVTILKVGRYVVDVDTNHPLAGKTLMFEIDVLAIRNASAEEIAHRHAHTAGGCQH